MKVIIESTEKIVHLVGRATNTAVEARVWEGYTETGIKVHCFITRIAISQEEPEEIKKFFEIELKEQRPPSSEIAIYPSRLIL